MLNLRPYTEDMDELEVGETIKVDHTDCPAGEDTRQRLYLTRTLADPTVVIAYCHNCQDGGHWVDETYASFRDSAHQAPTSYAEPDDTDSSGIPPKTVVFDTASMPSHALAYLYTKGRNLPLGYMIGHCIGYDSATDRMYLPITAGSQLKGYQLRKLRGYGPKYITVLAPGQDLLTVLLGGPSDRAAIVEDLLSGLAIQKARPEITVYVIHGVKVDPVLMHELARDYKEVIIWLDNDSDYVKHQADQMQRTINLYNPDVRARQIIIEDDPKNKGTDVIDAIIGEPNG